MSEWLNPSMLLACGLLLLGLFAAVYAVHRKIAGVGFRREDFDRRAGWIALGVILGAVLVWLGYR